MTEDIVVCQSKSIADLPITSTIHAPCPDMEGMKDPDPKKRERACYLLSKLREKHGIKRRAKSSAQPMNYVCHENGCVEPWGAVSNEEPWV